MSLATRCISCGTAFRVVQDQLKISEGWVRCGRCAAVFNALEGLFDLGRDPPPSRFLEDADDPFEKTQRIVTPVVVVSAAPGAHGGVGRATEAASRDAARPQASDDDPSGDSETFDLANAVLASAETDHFDELLAADPIDARLFRKRRAENDKAAPKQVLERDRNEFSDARFDSDLFADPAADDDPALGESVTTGAGDLPLESQETPQPEFLRRAQARTRWRSAPARAVLVGTGIVAGIVLGLQAVHHFRDTVAAEWPATAHALGTWCRVAGCTIGAPRRVREFVVESTTLTRAIGFDAYVLSVDLHSRSQLALTVPWVDLSLTDANGRLVARRALSPQDFGAAPVLPAGRDAALQLTLDGGIGRVAGYTVEIFYP